MIQAAAEGAGEGCFFNHRGHRGHRGEGRGGIEHEHEHGQEYEQKHEHRGG